MGLRSIGAASAVILLCASGAARAQFAGPSGQAAGPSISGAGTGLSAPSTIGAGSPGMGNPNAIQPPSAPAPVQPVYPGVGIGGAGLPPAAVLAPSRPRPARTPATPR